MGSAARRDRPPRRLFAVLASLAVGVSMAACGSSGNPASAPGESGPAKAGRTPELRLIQAQANRLLDGGPDAFEARLANLRGSPVVVNQWASWCGPCRFEFPFFQRLSRKYGDRVAFLGVNSKDIRGDAAKFLQEFPVPFPHYVDGEGSVARVFKGGRAWPTTAYYDRAGKLAFAHAGAYATQAKLEEDIRRYALGA